MSSQNEGDSADLSNINRILNSSPPDGKNLLENVSLMTTTTPMPSQDNTLQHSGSGPRNSNEGTNFLDKIRGKIGADRITEEHEKSNISTLTAFEDQLHEQLNGAESTAASSTPATFGNWKHTESGTTQIMYGFDLSPVHSLERKSHTKLDSLDTSEKQDQKAIDEVFKQGRQEVRAAPNFMQARVASPRHLRTEKGALSEDTETMMSQVFSSQDQSAPVTRSSLINEESPKPHMMKKSKKHIVHSNKKPGEKSPKSQRKKQNVALQRNVQSVYGARSMHDYSSHMRVSAGSDRKQDTSKVKSSPAAKKTPSKTTAPKQSRMAANIITPRSPKTRQSSVKVTSKIKSSPSARKSSPSLKQSSSQRLLLQSSKATLSSSLQSQSETSMIEKSPDFLPKKKELSSNKGVREKESEVLARMMEDLDHMRTQMKHVQEELQEVTYQKEAMQQKARIMTDENEQLKKDNFVMKSKITHLTSQNKSDVKQDSFLSKTNENDNEGQEISGVAKLKLEIGEQERLIKGYQQENERIYLELRNAKKLSQETEHAMYEENLKLKAEIANLEETVEKNERIIKDRKNLVDKMLPLSHYDSEKEGDAEDYLKKIKLLETHIKMEEGMRRKAETALKLVTEERDRAEKELQVMRCKHEDVQERIRADHKIEMEKLQAQLTEAQTALHSNRSGPNQGGLKSRLYRNNTNATSSTELSHFQQRVKKLENDLEKRDMLANQAVQSVQQQYNTVKMKYEERINDLELQIKSFRDRSLKGGETMEVRNLKAENETLKHELGATLSKLKDIENAGKREREELMKKTRILQENQRTPHKTSSVGDEYVELRKKCQLKDIEISKLNGLLKEALERKQKSSMHSKAERRKPQKPEYNPGMFEGEGYAGLSEENKELKKQLENLSIEMKHSKVINDAIVVKMEQEAKTVKDTYEKEIAFLKHEKTRSEQSTSKDVERNDLLKQQVTLLERELDKCKGQMLRQKDETREMAVLKIREQALQTQVQQLLKEIHQAKVQSPSASARKVTFLEDKLRVLEEQFRIKEETFKRALTSNSSSVLQTELRRMQEQLDEKNNQLSRFRIELDSILLVLNELQSQGVTIPLPKYLQSIF